MFSFTIFSIIKFAIPFVIKGTLTYLLINTSIAKNNLRAPRVIDYTFKEEINVEYRSDVCEKSDNCKNLECKYPNKKGYLSVRDFIRNRINHDDFIIKDNIVHGPFVKIHYVEMTRSYYKKN